MTFSLCALSFLLIAGGLLYHFLPLETFNLVVPKDKGARRIAANLSYGPDARQVLDIYAPERMPGPWPVVIFIHGGSWKSGSKHAYAFLARAIAARGFLVLPISYRLHPQNPYSAFVEDAALALDWAARQAASHGGDPQRLFALGHSAGAYNVAQAVLDPARRAALGAAAHALKGVATLAGPFDFLPLDSPISIEVFGKVTDLRGTQPINHARADAPPFLILHGSADRTCRPANSISLDRALRHAGAPSTLKLYAGVGHVAIMLAFARPLRRLATTLEDVTAFFRAQMKG